MTPVSLSCSCCCPVNTQHQTAPVSDRPGSISESYQHSHRLLAAFSASFCFNNIPLLPHPAALESQLGVVLPLGLTDTDTFSPSPTPVCRQVPGIPPALWGEAVLRGCQAAVDADDSSHCSLLLLDDPADRCPSPAGAERGEQLVTHSKPPPIALSFLRDSGSQSGDPLSPHIPTQRCTSSAKELIQNCRSPKGAISGSTQEPGQNKPLLT